MTTDTKKAFFSSIASAIFKYKKMPTTEDYIDVATVITHIKQLRNRMKERRKTPRKNRSATQTTDKKLEQPKKPMTSGTLIQVPPGEDKTSFERHNRLWSTLDLKERDHCEGTNESLICYETK